MELERHGRVVETHLDVSNPAQAVECFESTKAPFQQAWLFDDEGTVAAYWDNTSGTAQRELPPQLYRKPSEKPLRDALQRRARAAQEQLVQLGKSLALKPPAMDVQIWDVYVRRFLRNYPAELQRNGHLYVLVPQEIQTYSAKQLGHYLRQHVTTNESVVRAVVKQHKTQLYRKQAKQWHEVLAPSVVQRVYEIVKAWDLSCTSDIRAAKLSSPSQMRRFRRIERGGCCGVWDNIQEIEGENYIIGCNYGH